MEVQVFGETELEDRLRAGTPVFRNIISINDPGSRVSETIEAFAKKLLVLHFKDLDDELPQQDPVFDRLVTLDDIEKALRFARDLGNDNLTVHCWQGIARSTAIALCILHSRNLSDRDIEARMREIRPSAKPNERILKLYDARHGSRLVDLGRKLKALAVTKTGGDFRVADPQELDEYINLLNSSSLHITLTEMTEGGVTIHISGYIDSHNPEQLKRVNEAIARGGPRTVTFDCLGMSFISSSTVGLLFAISEHYEEQKVEFQLTRVSAPFAEVLDMFGFTRYDCL